VLLCVMTWREWGIKARVLCKVLPFRTRTEENLRMAGLATKMRTEDSAALSLHLRVKTHIQQLVIQFVETNRPLCFHELNHKLLAAPRRPAPLRCMCVFTLTCCVLADIVRSVSCAY
jgi:hypothetical protein